MVDKSLLISKVPLFFFCRPTISKLDLLALKEQIPRDTGDQIPPLPEHVGPRDGGGGGNGEGGGNGGGGGDGGGGEGGGCGEGEDPTFTLSHRCRPVRSSCCVSFKVE